MIASVQKRIFETYHNFQLSVTARAVRRQRLTYLSPAKLHNLEKQLECIERTDTEGDFVEFGVALGGSAILIAISMAPERSFTGFDLFGTIPPPSDADGPDSHARYAVIASGRSTGIGGDLYYGYEADLYNKVKQHFADFGLSVDGKRIDLVQGEFHKTVSFDGDKRIAFAHIDCDWHDPVALCLEKTYAQLSSGGVILLDDYNDYGGCRKATHLFLARHADMTLTDDSSNAVLKRR